MFLNYFEEKGHTPVESSSLVPGDDPTLLFTNAGMVQFKGTFLGTEPRDYKRATTSQKCVRAGGKHNDLENVGRTARHHTFFEMLGNFSFGDYFKEGAIEFAWDLLVGRMQLDTDKLWVSVHHSDDEAYAIWRDKMGVPEDRILKLGDKDNFWSMGDTGPCGPCSEILYDQGDSIPCDNPNCEPGICDCDRYLEIWNLVFMQYNRAADGSMTDLPNPSIDTGMGLERITAIMQGVPSNYDTDLFMPLISHIAELAGKEYGVDAETDVSIRVVADHARATTFLVCDGVLPSNEGRGYVLRRIIRRAARHGKLLGFSDSFLFNVAKKVIEEMQDVYPDLKMRKDFITRVIINEEDRFLKTLDKGLALLEEVMDKLQPGDQIPGKDVFMLYDTFGFPVDLTEDIAVKGGFGIDKAGFETEMAQQRQKARSASNFAGEVETKSDQLAPIADDIKVDFVGYSAMQTGGTVLALRSLDGKELESVSEDEEAIMIVDRTPFYGESGGQIGDTGLISSSAMRGTVTNTVKNDKGIILHYITLAGGTLRKGEIVTLMIDSQRRRDIMRHHSATHLLQKALQETLGEHAHQSGSLVTDKRLRFDFTHFEALTASEIAKIENIVNEYVVAGLPINTANMSKDKAVEKGAMALFGEKYGDEVRVVEMGLNISVELCGGTHCQNTGEIGLVKILSESSVSAGVRRIEAVAGMPALHYVQELASQVSAAGHKLKCSSDEIVERIGGLQERLKEQDGKIKELNLKIATGAGAAAGEEELSLGASKVVIKRVDGDDIAQIREVGDRIKDRLGSGIVFLASGAKGKATFMIMVTDDLQKEYAAGNLMKTVCEAVDGRGGGKPQFAQGGTADAAQIDKAIKVFKEAIS